MYKQILTVKDSEDHSKWLYVRNKGIGGSDAGIIMGLNPYKSINDLWLEKTNQVEQEDLTDNEYVYWGNQLEDMVAKEFAKRSNYKVRRMGTVQSNEYPFMIANIDRWIVGENFGLECKTANAFAGKNWEDDELPDSYYCQCLHYMAVTGAPCWYIAVLLGGNKFIYKKIDRNEDDIKTLIKEENKFWDLVKTKKAPPVDASKACANALNVMFKGNKDSETVLPDKALELIKNIDESTEIIDKLKEDVQLNKNKLMALMGDFEIGRVGNRKVTWKMTKGRESISISKLKKVDNASYEALKAIDLITVSEPTRRLRIY